VDPAAPRGFGLDTVEGDGILKEGNIGQVGAAIIDSVGCGS
jgi:hypothetical protein